MTIDLGLAVRTLAKYFVDDAANFSSRLNAAEFDACLSLT